MAMRPLCGGVVTPGTQITTSFNVTSGQVSRARAGTFASTKMSWSFPSVAIRSPGRRARTPSWAALAASTAPMSGDPSLGT
jgi:hypothetical protein